MLTRMVAAVFIGVLVGALGAAAVHLIYSCDVVDRSQSGCYWIR